MNLPLRAPALAALILFTISTGLAIDVAFGVPGQIAVTLWVWGVLTWLCLKSTDELRVRLIACAWISGIGEIGASLRRGVCGDHFEYFGKTMFLIAGVDAFGRIARSEERRVGKEC